MGNLSLCVSVVIGVGGAFEILLSPQLPSFEREAASGRETDEKLSAINTGGGGGRAYDFENSRFLPSKNFRTMVVC